MAFSRLLALESKALSQLRLSGPVAHPRQRPRSKRLQPKNPPLALLRLNPQHRVQTAQSDLSDPNAKIVKIAKAASAKTVSAITKTTIKTTIASSIMTVTQAIVETADAVVAAIVMAVVAEIAT